MIIVKCAKCNRQVQFKEMQYDALTHDYEVTAYCHDKNEIITVPRSMVAAEGLPTTIVVFKESSSDGISNKAVGSPVKSC
jgi:hypothetical protein